MVARVGGSGVGDRQDKGSEGGSKASDALVTLNMKPGTSAYRQLSATISHLEGNAYMFLLEGMQVIGRVAVRVVVRWQWCHFSAGGE